METENPRLLENRTPIRSNMKNVTNKARIYLVPGAPKFGRVNIHERQNRIMIFP